MLIHMCHLQAALMDHKIRKKLWNIATTGVVMAQWLKTLSLSDGKLTAQVRDLSAMHPGEFRLLAPAHTHQAV